MKESYLVYDVEVERGPDEVEGGWDNPEGMGFASAVVYDSACDQYFFFLGPDPKPLCKALHARTVVSFNGIKFDSRVILGNDRRLIEVNVTANEDGIGWENYDILLEYVKARFGYDNVADAEARLGDKAIHDGSFSLDGLAEGMFGLHKTGHGAHAPILYRNKQYAELFEYNLHDVRLTKKIFEFIQEYGYVIDRADRVIRV